ncbi:GxxExxY protein [Echinicola marina]|uniref:GxxExxY protein n=1 Tax=Echinicola marina TaxID=2859768 RepID=UPI001CF618E4|nr:GxxExxY protein [Echinicola marina]
MWFKKNNTDMRITQKTIDELTYKIIGCAIEVHKQIGPGLLESVYEKCFVRELQIQGMKTSTQQRIPLAYKGVSLEADLRYDVLVDNLIIVELKAMDGILPIHEAVLLTYMKMVEKPKGIIINFNCTNIFKYGQKTMVNEIYSGLPKA